MSASKPHSISPEELSEARIIAHSLVNEVYPSVPSYEMKLAYALVNLEEQLEVYEKAAREGLRYAEHMGLTDATYWVRDLRAALASSPASEPQDDDAS